MIRLQVVPGSRLPIYRQICDQIRQRIVSNALQVGDHLPSVRALAKELLINPNTVAKAYAELTRDGFLESQQGRGVFVAPRRQVFSDAESARRLEAALDAFVGEALTVGCTPEKIFAALQQRLDQVTPETSKAD